MAAQGPVRRLLKVSRVGDSAGQPVPVLCHSPPPREEEIPHVQRDPPGVSGSLTGTAEKSWGSWHPELPSPRPRAGLPSPHGPRRGRCCPPRTPGAAAARAPCPRAPGYLAGGGREPAEAPRPQPRAAAAAGPRGSAWQPRLPGEEPRGRVRPPLPLPGPARPGPPGALRGLAAPRPSLAGLPPRRGAS